MKILTVEGTPIDSPIRISCHHYSRLFHQHGNRVFYISTSISPFHLFAIKRLKETVGKLKRTLLFHKGLKNGNNLGINEYIPIVPFPVYNSPIFRSSFIINNSLNFSLPPFRRVLRNEGFDKPDVLSLSQITMHQVFDMVDARLKIYRATDDLTEFKQVPKKLIEVELSIVKRADIVISTSKRLWNRFSAVREKDTFHLPNGVETEAFRNGSSALPPEFLSIPSPRAIYVGSIDYWFDDDLLLYLAKSLPSVNFVIIGPQNSKLRNFRSFKNIHLLGRREYTSLPAYLKNSQAGIIPFRKSNLIESVCPVKLFEYMSCGLPVVSTRWEELEHIDSPALLANDKEEFLLKLQEALKMRENEGERARFMEFAENSSWDNRFKQLMEIISPRLGEK